MQEFLLRTPKKHYALLSIDTETTGIDFKKDEILQISILDDNGVVLVNKLCAPERVLTWPRAETLNGISRADVEDHAPFKEYASIIQELFDAADKLLVYNGEFDLAFIRQAGITINDDKIVDLMPLFAPIYGEWNAFAGYYRQQRLETCAKFYSVTYNSHNSLDDARATLACYKKYLSEVKK